jgi:N-acetylneuraminic acid mutarotase
MAATSVRAGAWRRLATSGPSPSERSVPAAASVGRSAYVFGGVKDDFYTQEYTFYNDLHRFDTLTNAWELLSPPGPAPPPRAFSSAVAHAPTGRVFVFGGGRYEHPYTNFTPLGDLWAYSVADNEWSEIHPRNPAPAPRAGNDAWIVGDRIYIFAGIDSGFATFNDLWTYDIAANSWTELIPHGAAGSPPPRVIGVAAARATAGTMTVYGGEGDYASAFGTLADTWQYDIHTNSWQEVTPAPDHDIHPPRVSGAAAALGDDLYLQGGDLPGGSAERGAPFPNNPTGEMWRFDTSRHVWTRLAPPGDPPAALKRQVAAVVDDRMYVFAGWDFRADNGGGPGQVWNLDTYCYDPTG